MIGLQFFRNCRGLSPFGSSVISPSICAEDRLSFLKLSFFARTSKVPISFQKNLKNSTVNPSEPGLVPFFIRFNVDRTSPLDILPFKLLHCSSVNFGMLSCSWIISSKLTSLICSSCLYKCSLNILFLLPYHLALSQSFHLGLNKNLFKTK